MLGLSTLGVVHTAISLVAVAAGFVALFRYREISSRTNAGQVFVIGTILSCLTGLGIFRHGGFGNPHVLAIVTLIVLAVAASAERKALFGRLSRYVAPLGYSFALFLHFIPGTVETLVRVPLGAPYLRSPEDQRALPIIGMFFLIFVVGAVLQARRIRSTPAGVRTPSGAVVP